MLSSTGRISGILGGGHLVDFVHKRRFIFANNRGAGRPGERHMKIQRPHIGARQYDRPRHSVRNVVMLPRTVINGVFPAARGLALQPVKLGNQAGISSS